MRNFFAMLVAAAPVLLSVTAFGVVNPSTGDNNIVPIIIGVMAAAAVGLVVVLLLTRNKR